MSDGPHRTLQMRQCWKKLAQCADIAASSPNELRDYMNEALEKDFSKEVQKAQLKVILEAARDLQGSLFPDQIERLEDLKTQCADHPLAHTFIDCLIDHVCDGNRSEAAIENALKDSLDIWGSRHIRQVEEHYSRNASRAKTDNVRRRLEAALKASDRSVISKHILNGNKSPSKPKPSKRSGLDDGVSL